MTEADLLSALRDCFAPLQRTNIVAAGLVKSAALILDTDAPGATIPGVPPRYLATLTLLAPSSSDEVALAQLKAQIENRLLGLAPISRVDITLLPALFPIL
jgi:hypothetical protein